MNLEIVIIPDAEKDLQDAVDFYEGKSDGLGSELNEEVLAALKRVAKNPERYGIAREDVRRAPVRRFKFSDYFRVRPDHVRVVAILDDHRDPAIWQQRT